MSINGAQQKVDAVPSTYVTLERDWTVGDVIAVEAPLTLHLDVAPDDKQVQAAMYGPLVLAARLGTEDLTTSMIYGDSGPRGGDDLSPMPTVDMRPHRDEDDKAAAAPPANSDAIWFEQTEPSRDSPLVFRTKGRGLKHTLVPLNQIMDERYSVYLRNITSQTSTT